MVCAVAPFLTRIKSAAFPVCVFFLGEGELGISLGLFGGLGFLPEQKGVDAGAPNLLLDVGAHQMVRQGAGHIVVPLSSNHVVPLVVLVQPTEIPCVAEAGQDTGGRPVLDGHVREAVHVGVERVPHQSVEDHSGEEDGHCLGEAELEDPHEDGEGGRNHLRRHHRSHLPGESSPAPRVVVERFGGGALHPLRVVRLKKHIIVRLGMVLDVAPAADGFGQTKGSREELKEPVLVVLGVLIVAVGEVLVDAHEGVQHRPGQDPLRSRGRRKKQRVRSEGHRGLRPPRGRWAGELGPQGHGDGGRGGRRAQGADQNRRTGVDEGVRPGREADESEGDENSHG
mmetsp:Transcript_51643/g.117590  ORF Transcript_51643/g.117590 Transcript_51643/m.117590 type:complete len:340 (-) Transcript_51643:79-1098(-)